MSSNRISNDARQLVHPAAAVGLAAALTVFGQAQTGAGSEVPVAQAPEPRLGQAEVDPAEARALEFANERVVVFKDGYGLFVKSASGDADAEGRLFTDEVPDAAVLGTFWATADGDEIVGMKAEWIEQTQRIEKETDCVSSLELLRANQGKLLSLQMVYGQTVTGTLVDVLEVPDEPVMLGEAPSTGAGHGHGRAAAEPSRSVAVPGDGQFAIMQTPAGMEVLPIGAIRTITGDDLATRMIRPTELTERSKRLWFDVGAAAAGRRVAIRLFYFTPGIRWIPTYRADGDLKDHGRLALQGEILNEVEDIEGAVFDLVVGVPNFRYKGTISPLSLERVMVDALRQSAPGLMGQQMSNVSFAQRAGEWRGDRAQPASAEGSAMAELAAELTATDAQDLFVYSVERLSLARGDRATVSLWQSVVPLRHLYTMDVQTVRDWRSGALAASPAAPNEAGSVSPLRLAANTVWHQLELTNSSDVPWTTGPAMLLATFLPLGQELLTYTPRGGRTLLPITVAVDVRGTYDEEEIDREPKAARWGNYQWDRVRNKGTVTLTNYRDEPVDMLVTVNSGGRAESASDGGMITISPTRAADWIGGHGAVNSHSEVVWKLILEPGASRTLTYLFRYYVR